MKTPTIPGTRCIITAVYKDYIVAETWDGLLRGDEIAIAKPHAHRHPKPLPGFLPWKIGEEIIAFACAPIPARSDPNDPKRDDSSVTYITMAKRDETWPNWR